MGEAFIVRRGGGITERQGDNVALASSISGTTLKLLAPEGGYDGIDDNVTITDANFTAANILSGKSVFGLAGTAKQAPHSPIVNFNAVSNTYESPRTERRIPVQNGVAYINGSNYTLYVFDRNGTAVSSFSVPNVVFGYDKYNDYFIATYFQAYRVFNRAGVILYDTPNIGSDYYHGPRSCVRTPNHYLFVYNYTSGAYSYNKIRVCDLSWNILSTSNDIPGYNQHIDLVGFDDGCGIATEFDGARFFLYLLSTGQIRECNVLNFFAI